MSRSPKALLTSGHISVLLSLAAVPLLYYLLPLCTLPLVSFPTATEGIQAKCPDHRYSVEIVSHDPLMVYVNDFLSEAEINWLLKKGESQYQRMLTYQGNSLSDRAVPDEGRTSYSAYLDKSDPIMACIGRRALDFHGGAQRALGDYGNPQLVRYEPEQKVNLHYDWWQEPQNRSGRLYNRRTTILAYLEDGCTGGETYFPFTLAWQCGLLGEFACERDGRSAHSTCVFACRGREEGCDELLATPVLLVLRIGDVD
ncbi:hypothetical protein BP00DRAFT_481846 [Aspergillus indologenus CBS 114.80]|uniref:Prolyl 4-hydroxylase alpha subunit domain-containing protein n=1 Tax=Aspergillus indologenus CBS 114.80 TaxID=1450541 RepID=A0A2V5HWA3_9EURO|nr:hypothetical protein BP00DRAFT_481846 [Aspergillus indologenus CBS 114.80]